MTKEQEEDLSDFFTQLDTIKEIEAEIQRAKAKHSGRYNSLHEGLAVLWEEFEELKETVFKDMPKEEVRKEAIQVAAVAIRFINELT